MRLLIVGIAAVALVGCEQVKGSGVKKTETRSVGKFSKVAVEGSADVNIKIGSGKSLSVTTDDNLLKLVETYVEGDTLYVKTKKSFSTRIGINVEITNPDLKGVAISGSGDIEAAVVRENTFSAAISGSGDMRVRGMATNVTASISGSGNIDLSGLNSTKAKASIAGSGDIDLTVSSQLDASIAGSGDISYKGSPKVTKSISGSGEIHAR